MDHELGCEDLEAVRSLQVVHELAKPLEREAVLQAVGRIAAESIEADLGFLGLIDEGNHLQLSHVHGSKTGSLETIRVALGHGLGGKVWLEEAPSSVHEYQTADSISHDYDEVIVREGLSGVLCIPLCVGDETLGVAYVSNRVPTHYSDTMISNVITAVESAKVALSIAERSREISEAAVVAERQRTLAVVDATMSSHLDKILSVAGEIAGDPNSSNDIIEKASLILQTVTSASGALDGISRDSDAPEPARSAFSGLEELTNREMQVIQHAALGLTNPEIGAELFLARGTVKAYMESALRKLGARNRMEAVMIAAKAGMLDDL